MDVRRIPLWEGRNAVVLSNETIRSVIEDSGGMVVELSALTGEGTRINAHPIYWFRGTKSSLADDENHEFWRNNQMLYHLGGSFFSFPNFGGGYTRGNMFYEPYGWTANGLWTVNRYGSDFDTGANWVLSSIVDPHNVQCIVKKIDVILPNQPVLYSSVSITNAGTDAIVANAAWHNTVGPPFLEPGCVINVSANRFSTAVKGSIFERTSRLALGKEFDDLAKVPTRNDVPVDISVVPGVIGFTDFVTGAIPSDARLGWSSVTNPRMKMMYLTFFTGPAALDNDDLPFYFNNLWMQYGGRSTTPWTLYDGGTDQTFCLGTVNSIGYYSEGLAKSLEVERFMGYPTKVNIPGGTTYRQRYATAFVPFESPKMANGIRFVEQTETGIILKHGKAWTFVESDSNFVTLKTLERTVL